MPPRVRCAWLALLALTVVQRAPASAHEACPTCAGSVTDGGPDGGTNADPFAGYGGKKTQIYLPVQEVQQLLTCGALELLGRARNSSVAGDVQQWFDLFKVHFHGVEVLSVGLRDATQLLPSDPSAAKVDTSVGSVDLQVLQDRAVAAALQRLRARITPASPRSLTTLSVDAQQQAVATTGVTSVADGAINVSVVQDTAREIGTGYVEVVGIEAADIGMKMMTSVAGMFPRVEDRIKNMHIDISFTRLTALDSDELSDCFAGILPELWGLQPMSGSTAKLLVAPSSGAGTGEFVM